MVSCYRSTHTVFLFLSTPLVKLCLPPDGQRRGAGLPACICEPTESNWSVHGPALETHLQVGFCRDPVYRICGDFTFEAQTGAPDPVPALPGIQWDCINRADDYTKYVLSVSAPGRVELTVSAAEDIDFVAFGPYASEDEAVGECASWGQGGKLVDCSFSTASVETVTFPAVREGEVYVLVLMNYAGVAQTVTTQQVGGAGSFGCAFVTCGDGTVQPGEECDDYNVLDGDGCSSDCIVEGSHAFCRDPVYRICGDFTFEAQTGGLDPVSEFPGIVWDCIESADDYTKYVLSVSAPGRVELTVSAAEDIGFVAFGPYGSEDEAEGECASWRRAGKVVGCVTSGNYESMIFRDVELGEVYVLVLMNYAQAAQTVNARQVGGPGSFGCTFVTCGDGTVQPTLGEECDDYNTLNGDGCTKLCMLETTSDCGDGILDVGEECDDGNRIDGDGWQVLYCGDGLLSGSEQCDDGNSRNCDGCDAWCVLEECGNGVLGCSEECDDGNILAGDGCNPGCLNEACGNGRIDTNEECDDGNRLSNDGCSHSCVLERSAVPGSFNRCGNGVLNIREFCDDGNRVSGDGCSANCTIEPARSIPFYVPSPAIFFTPADTCHGCLSVSQKTDPSDPYPNSGQITFVWITDAAAITPVTAAAATDVTGSIRKRLAYVARRGLFTGFGPITGSTKSQHTTAYT
eukprot:gene12877-biopygen2980